MGEGNGAPIEPATACGYSPDLVCGLPITRHAIVRVRYTPALRSPRMHHRHHVQKARHLFAGQFVVPLFNRVSGSLNLLRSSRDTSTREGKTVWFSA